MPSSRGASRVGHHDPLCTLTDATTRQPATMEPPTAADAASANRVAGRTGRLADGTHHAVSSWWVSWRLRVQSSARA
jgi:hypothetical protein